MSAIKMAAMALHIRITPRIQTLGVIRTTEAGPGVFRSRLPCLLIESAAAAAADFTIASVVA